MSSYKVKLTFTNRVLGTIAGDKEIFGNFIRSKAPDEKDTSDEAETLPDFGEEMARGTTGFHRVDGTPILYDYQIKGFFKDACGMLRRADDTASKGLKAYKKEIDGLIFVHPRQLKLTMPEGGAITFVERPLRAQTPQGERVALARSEAVPAGTTLEFTLTILKDNLHEYACEWLDYGTLRGLCQWRNAGNGTFDYTIEEVKPGKIVEN